MQRLPEPAWCGRAASSTFLAAILILSAVSSHGAGWSEVPTIIAAPPNTQSISQVAPGADGDCYFAWSDERPDGSGQNSVVHVYLTRLTQSGERADGWVADGTRIDGASLGSTTPRTLVEHASAYVCWEDFTEVLSGGGSRVRLTRLLSDGTRAPSYPDGGIQVAPPTARRSDPSMARASDGGLLIASQHRWLAGGDPGILITKHDSTGSTWPGWSDSGVVLCDVVGLQSSARIVPDATGGAFVVWRDGRLSRSSTYGHHVRGDGTLDPLWPEDGLELQTFVDGSLAPTAVSDGAGGFVFAQGDSIGCVDSTGTRRPGWPPSGRNRYRSHPIIASDGSPGAYVAWGEIVQRFPPTTVFLSSVFVCRYDLDGQPYPGWPDTGRVVFTGDFSDEQAPVLLLASPQSTYLVWSDPGTLDGYEGTCLTPTGDIAPGWTGPPRRVTNNPRDLHGALLPSGDAVIAWAGNTYVPSGGGSNEDTLFARRLSPDGIVSVLASVALAHATPDRTTIEWQVHDAEGVRFVVERSDDGFAWVEVGAAELLGGDRLRFEDSPLPPGARRAYRLVWQEGGARRTAGVAWVAREAGDRLAIRSSRLEATRLQIRLTVATREPITLTLHDVQGRRIRTLQHAPDATGELALEVDARLLAAGLYFVKVQQGTARATARVALTR